MDNRFKIKISPFLRDSFASCRPRKSSDIIENPVCSPHQIMDPFFSKPRPFPSICRPKFPETIETMNPLLPEETLSEEKSDFRNKILWENDDLVKTEKIIEKTESSSFSDCSVSRRLRRRYRRKEHRKNHRKIEKIGNFEMGFVPLEGKMKDSFVIVKSSSDPYNDFRSSMVEMIVENKMYLAEDLEELLNCFLSLNSEEIHVIIVEVFMEILDSLFF